MRRGVLTALCDAAEMQNGEPGSSPFCPFRMAAAMPNDIAYGPHRKSGVRTVSMF